MILIPHEKTADGRSYSKCYTMSISLIGDPEGFVKQPCKGGKPFVRRLTS
jgi:hypothetical protein